MKVIKTTKIFIVIVVIVIFVFLVSILDKSQKDLSDMQIKIGAIFPLSGPNATYGEMAKDAIDLAITKENINNVKVIYEDSQFQSLPALNAYKKLKSESVQVFMTIGSQVAATIGPMARNDGLMNFELTAVTPAYEDHSVLTCRAALTVRPSAKILAEYAKINSFKKIALFVTNDEQGEAYDKIFSELASEFATIVDRERYQLADNDFKTQIIKIKSSNPDVLLLISPGQHATSVLKQLRELGFNKPILSNNWTIENSSLTNLSLANGVVFSGYLYGSLAHTSNKDVVNFRTSFNNEYGQNPPIVSATAYDAIRLLSEIINRGAYSPKDIAVVTSQTNNYHGISGNWSFDSDCEADQDAILKTVVDGKIAELK